MSPRHHDQYVLCIELEVKKLWLALQQWNALENGLQFILQTRRPLASSNETRRGLVCD